MRASALRAVRPSLAVVLALAAAAVLACAEDSSAPLVPAPGASVRFVFAGGQWNLGARMGLNVSSSAVDGLTVVSLDPTIVSIESTTVMPGRDACTPIDACGPGVIGHALAEGDVELELRSGGELVERRLVGVRRADHVRFAAASTLGGTAAVDLPDGDRWLVARGPTLELVVTAYHESIPLLGDHGLAVTLDGEETCPSGYQAAARAHLGTLVSGDHALVVRSPDGSIDREITLRVVDEFDAVASLRLVPERASGLSGLRAVALSADDEPIALVRSLEWTVGTTTGVGATLLAQPSGAPPVSTPIEVTHRDATHEGVTLTTEASLGGLTFVTDAPVDAYACQSSR